MAGEPHELTEYKTDHDLLIELRVLMTEIRRDMRDMKDATSSTLADHEKRLREMEGKIPEKLEERLRTLEAQQNSWLGKQSIIGGGVGLAASLIGSYISAGRL